MISPMLFSRPELSNYNSEEDGEELYQDGGEWSGYIREQKDGSKKCMKTPSCFRCGKTMLEFLRRHLIFECTDLCFFFRKL